MEGGVGNRAAAFCLSLLPFHPLLFNLLRPLPAPPFLFVARAKGCVLVCVRVCVWRREWNTPSRHRPPTHPTTRLAPLFFAP